MSLDDKIRDEADLVPLAEFARALGRSVEATRRGMRDSAVERRGRIYFRRALLDELLANAPPEAAQFTVSGAELARELGVDRRTVDRRLRDCPSVLVRGQRMYREQDAEREREREQKHERERERERERKRQEEFLNGIDVTILFGGHHMMQLHMLVCYRRAYKDPKLKIPLWDRCEEIGWEWKRGTIEAWARDFKQNPAKYLNEVGLDVFEAAADPRNSGILGVPVFEKHFEICLKHLDLINAHLKTKQEQTK